MTKLNDFGKGRALDVSCGDGRVTRELLLRYFDKIDMFDQCKEGIEKCKALKRDNPEKIDRVDIYQMQTFKWKERYDRVFLTWCTGYLTNDELINFLKKAKSYLNTGNKRK